LASTKLSCISPLDKKAWNSGEAFFGLLKGGFVKDFPVSFCRGLLSQSQAHEHLLNQLGSKMEFDINIGFNGKVWVKGRMIDIVFIMNAFERFVQTKGDLAQVEKLLSVLN
jgi:exosome complex RNA-binding protein Rrp4